MSQVYLVTLNEGHWELHLQDLRTESKIFIQSNFHLFLYFASILRKKKMQWRKTPILKWIIPFVKHNKHGANSKWGKLNLLSSSQNKKNTLTQNKISILIKILYWICCILKRSKQKTRGFPQQVFCTGLPKSSQVAFKRWFHCSLNFTETSLPANQLCSSSDVIRLGDANLL